MAERQVDQRLLNELLTRFEIGMPFLDATITEKSAQAAYNLYSKAPDTDLTVLIVYGMGFAHGYSDQVIGKKAWDGFEGMDPRLVTVNGLGPVWDKVVDSGGYELASRAFEATSEILCDIPDEDFIHPFQLGCAKFATIGYMNGAVAAAKEKKSGELPEYDANSYRFDQLVEYSKEFIGTDEVKELLDDHIAFINEQIFSQLTSDIVPKTGAYRQYSVIPDDKPSFSVRAYTLGLVEGIVDAMGVIEDGELPDDAERYNAEELFVENDKGEFEMERIYFLADIPVDALAGTEFVGAAFPAAQLVDAKFCRCGLPIVARLMGIDALNTFVDRIEDFLNVDMSNMDIYEQGELAVLNASLNVCTRQMGYGYADGWKHMLDQDGVSVRQAVA